MMETLSIVFDCGIKGSLQVDASLTYDNPLVLERVAQLMLNELNNRGIAVGEE